MTLRISSQRLFNTVLLIAGMASVQLVGQAHGLPCRTVAALASMARAKTMAELSAARVMAGPGFRTNVVFAYRAFQIRRSRKSADRLLHAIPRDTAQLAMIIGLQGALCAQESTADMQQLGEVENGFARELSRAVLIEPGQMPRYVAHSLDEVQVPGSDYAVQMRTVCMRRPREFRAAVDQMGRSDRAWFASHVMDPSTCRVLDHPESQGP